jgi:hypothetical protein
MSCQLLSHWICIHTNTHRHAHTPMCFCEVLKETLGSNLFQAVVTLQEMLRDFLQYVWVVLEYAVTACLQMLFVSSTILH